MKWIGLTGGIASGKTTVANMFRELAVPVVDADRLAHLALIKNKEKIVTYFGREILDEKGEIHRRKLGEKVFENPKQLKNLEEMIHPFVQEKVREKRRLFEIAEHALAVYDVPLLYENKLQSSFDEVILVYVPEDISKKRLIKRSGLSEQEAEARLKMQMAIENKKKLADVVFNNEGDRDALKELVINYYNSIKE